MSALAKTFTVIVTILSIAFISMESALFHHSKNWRDAFVALAKDYQGARQAFDQGEKNLKTQIETRDKSIQSRTDELDRLRAAYAKLADETLSKSSQLAQKMQEFDKLLDQNTKTVALVETQENRIAALERDLTRTQDEREQALQDKETAENQVARLTSIKTSLEKDLSELRVDYTTTKQGLEDYKIMEQQLIAAGVDIPRIVKMKAAPAISAKVLAVQDDVKPGLVLLSVGKKDGVQEGYEFTIYRAAEFIARVVVVRTLDDMSGARVVFKRSDIQKSDEASTRVQ